MMFWRSKAGCGTRGRLGCAEERHVMRRKTTDFALDGCCCSELGGTEAPKEREEYAPRVRGASMHATRVRCGTGSLGFGCRGGSGAVARAHGPCFRDGLRNMAWGGIFYGWAGGEAANLLQIDL